MKNRTPLLLLLFTLTLAGCQSVAFTAAWLIKGPNVEPKYDILLKGDKRVAIVPRSMYTNAYELQNAPQEIARQVNFLLDENVKNKKLKIVEQLKVEAWLDNCNNNFDTFTAAGKDKSINADIVIGIDIIGFQIRDPQNAHLIQGKCQVQVKAVECETERILASETLSIVYPPSMPTSGGPQAEARLRPEFIQIVAENIAALFHHHDPKKVQRMDADSINLHRF